MRIGLTRSAAAATRAEKLDPEVDAALERAASVLRAAGHTVVEIDVPYGLRAKSATLRYLGGIAESVDRLDDPSLLEPRTRGIVRLGKPVGQRAIAAAGSAR